MVDEIPRDEPAPAGTSTTRTTVFPDSSESSSTEAQVVKGIGTSRIVSLRGSAPHAPASAERNDGPLHEGPLLTQDGPDYEEADTDTPTAGAPKRSTRADQTSPWTRMVEPDEPSGTVGDVGESATRIITEPR